MVTTIAGQQGVSAPFSDGIGTLATFNFPRGIGITSDGSFSLVVSETRRRGGHHDLSRHVSLALARIPRKSDNHNHIIRLLVLSSGVVTTFAGRLGVTVFSDGIGTEATFNHPEGIAMRSDGKVALVVRVEAAGRVS